MKTLIQLPATGSQDQPWVEYGTTSTIVGWSSFTVKSIRYKVIGKMVAVTFNITGTSNSATTTFTLPFPVGSTSTSPLLSQGNGINNGVIVIISPTCFTGSSVAQFTYYTAINAVTGSWTSSGTKAIRGQFVYEID